VGALTEAKFLLLTHPSVLVLEEGALVLEGALTEANFLISPVSSSSTYKIKTKTWDYLFSIQEAPVGKTETYGLLHSGLIVVGESALLERSGGKEKGCNGGHSHFEFGW
jgi:hypothetical protein